MTYTFPITKIRKNLTTFVDNTNRKLEEYVVTVNGEPAAVLISFAEYQSWKETNGIMADKELLHAMMEGEKNIKDGEFVTFEQLKKDLKLHV